MGNIDQNFRWLLGHINLSALPSLNFVSMHGCASFYPATLSQWPWRWVSTMSQSKLDAMNGAFDLDRWHLLDANCCAKRTNIIWREIISHTHNQGTQSHDQKHLPLGYQKLLPNSVRCPCFHPHTIGLCQVQQK